MEGSAYLTLSEILLAAYPIGSYYWSSSAAPPRNFLAVSGNK